MVNNPCKNTKCKHHASQSLGTRRYGDICLHTGKCIAETISENVKMVLTLPVSKADQYAAKLTDAELDYCIANETRKTAIKNLKQWKKYRQESRVVTCER